jgi:hypothetical protein
MYFFLRTTPNMITLMIVFQLKLEMRNILKNRMALSTVVTTLIILVVSVLLAGVVTYFAINVTSTRVQEESLALTKQHIWYDAETGQSEACIMIINTGGRDIVIDKLTIRGQEASWTGATQNISYCVTDKSISKDLTFIADDIDAAGADIDTMVGVDVPVLDDTTADLTLQ